MFARILSIILPVFCIIAVGYAYARWRGKAVNADMASVNRICTEVLSPLLVFTAMAAKDFDLAQNAMLIAAGVLISLGSGLLAWPLARALGYDVRTFLPPMMYNNCGNMGLPLAALAFGQAGLSAAVALFMACNLVYFSIGIKILAAGKSQGRIASWRLLLNPMMLAMMAGLVVSLVRIDVPAPLFQGLKMLGEASIPVMLFALGVRMRDVTLNSWQIGMVGAAVCPLAGLAVAWALDQLLPLPAAQSAQMYLFAALPPAVFCFMMAEQYRQEPDKVASIVLLGNLSALLFVPLGLWLGLRA
jgi:malate permease and related proteins